MDENAGRRVAVAIVLGLVLACGVIFPPLYTTAVLHWASRQGVYETPQQGVIARAYQYYCDVKKVDIEQAATNSFDGSNSHVWYVIWRVYARSHTPCDGSGEPLYHNTYENGGNFYMNTKEGWVFMPEGFFPEILGKWMIRYELAGPGNPYHVPRE